MLPQAVTAYYRHGLNQVVVPAGLLRPPVFTAGADPARDHAVLGAIVCHEMAHAFVRAWRTGADRAEFDRRTAALAAQYDRYTPEGPGGRRVSGTRTLAENIADIAGLTVAQAAFDEHLASRGVTGSARRRELRRFFVLWASMWRGKRTPERMRERLENDTHAPPIPLQRRPRPHTRLLRSVRGRRGRPHVHPAGLPVHADGAEERVR